MQTHLRAVIAKTSLLSANVHLLEEKRHPKGTVLCWEVLCPENCFSLHRSGPQLPQEWANLSAARCFARMTDFLPGEKPKLQSRSPTAQSKRCSFSLPCFPEAQGYSNNPSSPFLRRASKERGDLRQGTMESIASSFHGRRRSRRRRRKKVKTASTACLQIFLFPLVTKMFHSPLSTLGGEMLCFWGGFYQEF